MSHHDHEHPALPRRVEVVGSGEVSGTPDVVRLRLGLTAVAPDVASALGRTGELVTAVGAAVRRHGVADADIVSAGADVSAHWDQRAERHEGYEAHHRLTVVVRELASLDPVVAAVAEAAGAGLSIDGIGLELADPAPLEVRARAAAFADARAKAAQFADLAGSRLGAVLDVTEGAAAPVRPFPRGGMPRAMAASASMPVEAGEYTVSATVTVAFALLEGEAEPARAPE